MPICKVVKKSKSQEQKNLILKAEMKWDVALPSPVEVLLPRCTVLVFQVTEFSGPVALAHDSSALSLEILGELSVLLSPKSEVN